MYNIYNYLLSGSYVPHTYISTRCDNCFCTTIILTREYRERPDSLQSRDRPYLIRVVDSFYYSIREGGSMFTSVWGAWGRPLSLERCVGLAIILVIVPSCSPSLTMSCWSRRVSVSFSPRAPGVHQGFPWALVPSAPIS